MSDIVYFAKEVAPLRIEQLEYLLEIYRQNSMKAAAEQLHMTPQALSSTIKSLEQELNIKIFRRSNKGISLTEEAKPVVEFADTTIAGYLQMLQSLQNNSPAATIQKGPLVLYVAPVFLESILPFYITKFKNDYPKVSIELIQRNTLNISETLQQNMTDYTIGAIIVPYDGDQLIHRYLPADYNNFSFKILNRNYYFACVPKDSPFAYQKTVSIKKLLECPIVDYCAGNAGTAPLIPLLKKYQPKFKTSLTLSSISLWIEAIQNHTGIGFINSLFTRPDSIVRKQLDNLVLLKLKEPLITFNYFVYAKHPAPYVTAFLNQFPDYIPKKNDPEVFL